MIQKAYEKSRQNICQDLCKSVSARPFSSRFSTGCFESSNQHTEILWSSFYTKTFHRSTLARKKDFTAPKSNRRIILSTEFATWDAADGEVFSLSVAKPSVSSWGSPRCTVAKSSSNFFPRMTMAFSKLHQMRLNGVASSSSTTTTPFVLGNFVDQLMNSSLIQAYLTMMQR